MNEQTRQRENPAWILIGAVAGLVAVPTLVALTAVLVRGLRDPLFDDHPLAALVVTGTAGLAIGAAVASRALRGSPRVMVLFGSLAGAVVGAAAAGSLALWIEVSDTEWPSGMAAFITGAIVGAIVGGLAGGVLASTRANLPAAG